MFDTQMSRKEEFLTPRDRERKNTDSVDMKESSFIFPLPDTDTAV